MPTPTQNVFELVDSRRPEWLGENAYRETRLYRVAGVEPYAVQKDANPKFPKRGEILKAPIGDLTLLDVIRLQIRLRQINADWWPRSTNDSIVELVYQSGPSNYLGVTDAKVAKVELDIGSEAQEVYFDINGDELPDPRQVPFPVTNLRATMEGVTFANDLVYKIEDARGTLNNASFYFWDKGEVLFLGAQISPQTGTGVYSSPTIGSIVTITYNFQAKPKESWQEAFPITVLGSGGGAEISSIVYKDVLFESDFKLIAPADWQFA